jgi:hypothetical protein
MTPYVSQVSRPMSMPGGQARGIGSGRPLAGAWHPLGSPAGAWHPRVAGRRLAPHGAVSVGRRVASHR